MLHKRKYKHKHTIMTENRDRQQQSQGEFGDDFTIPLRGELSSEPDGDEGELSLSSLTIRPRRRRNGRRGANRPHAELFDLPVQATTPCLPSVHPLRLEVAAFPSSAMRAISFLPSVQALASTCSRRRRMMTTTIPTPTTTMRPLPVKPATLRRLELSLDVACSTTAARCQLR